MDLVTRVVRQLALEFRVWRYWRVVWHGGHFGGSAWHLEDPRVFQHRCYFQRHCNLERQVPNGVTVEQFEYIVVALVWAGVAWAAITGTISTPRYEVRRSDNPSEFRAAFWWFTASAAVATGVWFAIRHG